MNKENKITRRDALKRMGAAVISGVVASSVCPRGNYQLGARDVTIQGDCEFCFACIQNCPQKAIQFVNTDDIPLLRNGEVNPNARYRNEHISLMDIKLANNQF